MNAVTPVRDVFINGRFLSQPLSGMQRYAEELVGALDDRLASDDTLATALRVTVLVPRGPRRAARAWSQIATREVGRLQGHIWEQIELGQAAWAGTLLSLGGTGPLLHRRHIVALHDANVFANPASFSPLYGGFHRWLRPRLARRASRLVTISHFSASELGRYCGVPVAAFTLIHDSAEHITHVTPVPDVIERHGLARGRYLLCVGNLSPNKNLAVAVAAMERLMQTDMDLDLAIAGGGVAAVFSNVTTLSGDRIKLLGRVSDGELRALYQHAAAFVFPSRYEGFGVPPLEAMSLGCPVVASSTSAMPEILGDAPLYFDPGQPDRIARCVAKLLADPAARQRRIAAGYRQAGRYSWAKGAEALTALIQGS